MKRVFLSHSGADTAAARELRTRLLADGTDDIEIWFDKTELKASHLQWQAQIESAIAKCDAFILLVGLCHVNSDERIILTKLQIKQPQFRTIQRMLWRGFDGEFGETPDGAAN